MVYDMLGHRFCRGKNNFYFARRTVIHFSDLKPHLNKYLLELWQLLQDKSPHKKLHKLFPKLNNCISCPHTTRRKETISQLHISHLYLKSYYDSHLLFWREKSQLYAFHVMSWSYPRTYFDLLLFWFAWSKAALFYHLLYEDLFKDCTFDYLKEVEIFWK